LVLGGGCGSEADRGTIPQGPGSTAGANSLEKSPETNAADVDHASRVRAEEPGLGVCTDHWSRDLARNHIVPAGPDSNNAYYAWFVDREHRARIDPQTDPKRVGFRLQGRFPFGRFFSFQIYDAEMRNAGDRSVLTGDQMLADQGSVNPWTTCGQHCASDRDYTVWIIPQALADGGAWRELVDPQTQANMLVVPDSLLSINIWLRAYAVDPAWGEGRCPGAEPGIGGGASPPTITAFDVQPMLGMNAEELKSALTDLESFLAACPRQTLVQTDVRPPNVQPSRPEGIHFYPIPSDAIGANAENHYVVAQFDQSKPGDLAVITAAKPITATNANKCDDPPAEVRYFSFCSYNPVTLTASDCVKDDEFHDLSGRLKLLLGDRSLTTILRQWLADRGQQTAAIPWGKSEGRVVWLRQNQPADDFAGNYRKAYDLYYQRCGNPPDPNCENVPALDDPAADLGDYAPRGRICNFGQTGGKLLRCLNQPTGPGCGAIRAGRQCLLAALAQQ
jgi:hypothetical protein